MVDRSFLVFSSLYFVVFSRRCTVPRSDSILFPVFNSIQTVEHKNLSVSDEKWGKTAMSRSVKNIKILRRKKTTSSLRITA